MARRQTGFREEIGIQIKGILIIAVAVFCYAGVVYADQAGELGLFVHNLFRTIAGDTAVVIPFLIGILGLRTMLPEQTYNLKSRLIGILHPAAPLHHLGSFQANARAGRCFYRAGFLPGQHADGAAEDGRGSSRRRHCRVSLFCFKEIGSYIVIAALALVATLLITNVTVTQNL